MHTHTQTHTQCTHTHTHTHTHTCTHTHTPHLHRPHIWVWPASINSLIVNHFRMSSWVIFVCYNSAKRIPDVLDWETINLFHALVKSKTNVETFVLADLTNQRLHQSIHPTLRVVITLRHHIQGVCHLGLSNIQRMNSMVNIFTSITVDSIITKLSGTW